MICFIKKSDGGDTKSALNYLISKNKGPNEVFIGQKKSTIVLMDATRSMKNLLNATKDTVCMMFDRACEVLKELDYENVNDLFELQFAVYRNYNASEVLQYSTFSSKSQDLKDFMTGIDVDGGLGDEAIEIGFWHVNKEAENRTISQVLLIGDAPPQSKEESKGNRHRNIYNRRCWEGKDFENVYDYEEQMRYLKKIKIFLFIAFILLIHANIRLKKYQKRQEDLFMN